MASESECIIPCQHRTRLWRKAGEPDAVSCRSSVDLLESWAEPVAPFCRLEVESEVSLTISWSPIVMVDAGCCRVLTFCQLLLLFAFKIVLGMKKCWLYFTDKQTEALHRGVKWPNLTVTLMVSLCNPLCRWENWGPEHWVSLPRGPFPYLLVLVSASHWQLLQVSWHLLHSVLHLRSENWISLCSSVYPKTWFVDQAGLELRKIHLPLLLSAGIKNVSRHIWSVFGFVLLIFFLVTESLWIWLFQEDPRKVWAIEPVGELLRGSQAGGSGFLYFAKLVKQRVSCYFPTSTDLSFGSNTYQAKDI